MIDYHHSLQTGFVYALHSYWTSTKIPFRLCFHGFCGQWQIPTEVHWLRGLHSAKNKNKIWWTWLLLLRSSPLEHSSIRPSWYYWYQYISKTTQECTFWSCFWLILLALLDVSYSGALQILRSLIDWLIDSTLRFGAYSEVFRWCGFWAGSLIIRTLLVGRIAELLDLMFCHFFKFLFYRRFLQDRWRDLNHTFHADGRWAGIENVRSDFWNL